MNEDVRLSRLRISRRRALSAGGTIGLTGLLAACGAGSSAAPTATAPATATAAPAAAGDVVALLDSAGTCTLALQETQGPYWFDVDDVRSDIREERPGTELTLALRVHDVSQCAAGGAVTAVPDAVVEIWHCDAGGLYSGFESGSTGGGGTPPGGGGPGGAPPSGAPGDGGPGGAPGGGAPGGTGSGETSDGSYSAGDQEATTTDDGTYLRGAQVADARGIVQFTTVFPGWYRGRTTHIHVKVHIDRATVLTTQVFVDDALADAAYAVAPYSDHTGRDTYNADDSIFDASGLLTVQPTAAGYLGVLNLGIDV